MKHLPLRECGYAIAVLVVLLLLYGGDYLALAMRIDVTSMIHAEKETVVLAYRFGGDGSKAFFSPAHQIDRLIRFDFWNGEVSIDAFRDRYWKALEEHSRPQRR